jgi:hypothetical protein
MLLVSQNIKRRMVGCVNNNLGRMWKEVVVT